jgi:TusA-related sulfurtransferase
MSVGEILEVLADDTAADEDIKSLVKRTGHELLELSRKGDVLRFLIKKAK